MQQRSMTTWLLVLIASLAMAGCSTINPYTGKSETSNATTGAVIGAAAGAAAGLATGDSATSRRDRALIGAAAGGGIGYYMDVQEAKLRQQLASTGVSVTRRGNEIILNLPGNITFATDSAQVGSRGRDILHSVSLVLDEYDRTNINVAGFTDSTGSDQYNLMLSKQRAQSVANVLQNNGVAYARLSVQGKGEAYPVASNATPAGRANNRRVELTLFPSGR